MAKAISDEELQLKKRARRRLVGAVALVLLIVVFLPMVLDSEPKPLNQDVSINIPPVPKAESASQLPAPPAEAVAAAANPQPHVAGMPDGQTTQAPDPKPDAPVAAPAKPEQVKPEVTTKPRAEAKPVAKPVPKHEAKPVVAAAAPAASGSDDNFVVQLGAFSNAANAKALQRKLQDNKFKAYTELVKNAGGERTRVRVGPYGSREAAEKARDRLRSMKLIIGDAAVVRQD